MLTSNWTNLSEHKIQRYNKEEFCVGLVEELNSCMAFSATPCQHNDINKKETQSLPNHYGKSDSWPRLGDSDYLQAYRVWVYGLDSKFMFPKKITSWYIYIKLLRYKDDTKILKKLKPTCRAADFRTASRLLKKQPHMEIIHRYEKTPLQNESPRQMPGFTVVRRQSKTLPSLSCSDSKS